MVAPVVAGKSHRKIYLPPGGWFDFWTNQFIEGDTILEMDVPLDIVPVYVKTGAILPLAEPTLNTANPDSYKLQANIYGDGSLGMTLFEDDGHTFEYKKGQFNRLFLTWDKNLQTGSSVRSGGLSFPAYSISSWKAMG